MLNLAVIHTEAEFVHIGLHVPDRDMVVDAINAPLDDCLKRLNTVCMFTIAL